MSYNSEPIYELCFDPARGDVLVYRSIPAGVCGPFSEPFLCHDRGEAERIAEGLGYTVTGPWEAHTNYDSAPLARGKS